MQIFRRFDRMLRTSVTEIGHGLPLLMRMMVDEDPAIARARERYQEWLASIRRERSHRTARCRARVTAFRSLKYESFLLDVLDILRNGKGA